MKRFHVTLAGMTGSILAPTPYKAVEDALRITGRNNVDVVTVTVEGACVDFFQCSIESGTLSFHGAELHVEDMEWTIRADERSVKVSARHAYQAIWSGMLALSLDFCDYVVAECEHPLWGWQQQRFCAFDATAPVDYCATPLPE